MRFLQAVALLPTAISLAAAQEGASCYRSESLMCTGARPQCTVDNKGAVLCCARGVRAFNGECLLPSATVCGDGNTICSEDTPQCTVNNSVYADNTGKVHHNFMCCPSGHKALNGKCYPGDAQLMPCYQVPGVCDWGKGYYCAWNAGNADSRCCKLDEYYNGNTCVKKP